MPTKLLFTKHWYVLCLLAAIDTMKEGGQKGAAVNLINEIGEQLQYFKMKPLELESMKLYLRYKHTPWVLRFVWWVPYFLLKRQFGELRKQYSVPSYYIFEPSNFSTLFEMAKQISIPHLSNKELAELMKDLDEANSNITQRKYEATIKALKTS